MTPRWGLAAILLLAADYPGTGRWQGLWDLTQPAYAYAQSRNGTVGVAVYDDTSGALYTYNGTVQIRCASTIKVGIMAAVLDRAAREGRWLTSWEEQQLGPMIRSSDNTAATNLWNYVGPSNILAYLSSVGLTHTQSEPGIPISWWGHTLTTAKDLTVLIARLHYRQIATPALCDYGIGLMTQVVASQSWGIKAGVPGDAWVAFKNGWYPEETVWRVHSAGVVRSASGRTFVLSVLTRYDVALGMQYGMDTAQEVSARVWSAVAGPVASAAAVKVTAPTLNVRSGPGTSYGIIGTVSQDQVYIRTLQQNGWSRIYYAGNTGWCSNTYLLKLSGVSAVKVIAEALNVRTGPGAGYPIAGQIYRDQMYFWTQYEGLNGWYKITWKGGVYYAYGAYLARVPLP